MPQLIIVLHPTELATDFNTELEPHPALYNNKEGKNKI